MCYVEYHTINNYALHKVTYDDKYVTLIVSDKAYMHLVSIVCQ